METKFPNHRVFSKNVCLKINSTPLKHQKYQKLCFVPSTSNYLARKAKHILCQFQNGRSKSLFSLSQTVKLTETHVHILKKYINQYIAICILLYTDFTRFPHFPSNSTVRLFQIFCHFPRLFRIFPDNSNTIFLQQSICFKILP